MTKVVNESNISITEAAIKGHEKGQICVSKPQNMIKIALCVALVFILVPLEAEARCASKGDHERVLEKRFQASHLLRGGKR